MTDNQLKLVLKFLAAVLLFVAWGGALWIKHLWPDIDTSAIILAIQSALGWLGITHYKGNQS